MTQFTGLSLGRTRIATSTIIILSAFLCLDGLLGPLSFEIRRVIASFALAAFAVAAIGKPSSWRRVGAMAAIVFIITLVLRAPSIPVALVGFILVLAAVWFVPPTQDMRQRLPDGLIQVLLAYALARFTVDLGAQFSTIGPLISGWSTRFIGHATDIEHRLSFLALGGFPVLMASTYMLWRWRLSGSPARLGLAIILPAAWFIATVVMIPDASSGPLAAFGRGTLHGLAYLAMAILLDIALPSRIRSPQGRFSSAGRRLFLVAICLLAALGGTCSVGTALIAPPVGRKILVHNRGGLDWDRPVFGRFGAFSGGMFGLLPVYCRAEGYEFDVIDKDSIGPDDLSAAQILVLINSPKTWSGAERRAVLEFVDRGGSLLVLGDHTDVFGLMRGFNGLLDSFGIQFRFDSAYRAREGWRGCQAAAPDAIGWGWDVENPSVAVGASLGLSGSARSLLTGRYGFSDAGIRENYAGSFLGNYRYDREEMLGDVVLVATAAYGRGRVVVWGDTSAFQGGLSWSYPKVVGPMLSWLSRRTAWTERPLGRWLTAVGLMATILGLWLVRATVSESALVAASLLAGLLITWGLSLPNLDNRVRVAGDTILVDRSHMPASGHYEARINPVGPLYTNLLRCGYRVVDQEQWDSSAIRRTRGIAFIAPQQSFSQREIEDLIRAEEGGAVVILAVGQPDAAGSHRLLDAHGLALAPRPLGTISSAGSFATRREREREPRFLDAWPIVMADGSNLEPSPGVEVIFRNGRDVTALFRRRGRGGLLLFSDTRFFSDMNVEDVYDPWLGNLALIHDAFRRYLGAEPDAVRPLFPSPEKPL